MAGIPQVITEDRASGAQVVDGSLRFDSSKSQYLKKTFTADGNRKLWTWSGWLKRTPGALHDIFSAGQEVTNDGLYSRFRIDSDDCLNYRQWVTNSSLDAYLVSSMKLRDPSAYFHYVAIYDSNNSTNSDKVRFYINGQRVTVFSSNDYPGGTNSSWVNSSSKTHTIGGHYDGGTSADSFFNGHMSQVYFLDGIAAGPEEFGYTDPLTGTWRPKKFDSFNNPNNGTTWSNLTTASSGSFEGSLPKTNLFDGIASNANRANLDTVGASIDIDFSSNPITVKNTISIWSGKANLSYSINGGAYVNYSDAAEAYKDIPFTGTLTSLSLTKSDEGAGASAIKIDGYILIDGAPNNSFYLPLDGNSPVGKDQSGNGNDWTPVNFGGSVELPRATGAIPILNTNEAGTVAKPGARTDSKTYTVTASGGNYYLDGALKPTLNAYRGGSYTFDYTGATSHPFYLSSLQDGKWNSKAYSVQFDGTGDELDFAGDSDFAFGTGDFTAEAWVYPDSHANYRTIIDTRASDVNSTTGWIIGINAAGQVYVYSGNFLTGAAGPLTAPTNTWTHIAYTRTGGTHRLFVNGSLSFSSTDAKDYTDTVLSIGAESYGGTTFKFVGKISNVRLIKGQSLYSSNFTPPGTALTTTSQGATASNVKLLCCQDNAVATTVVSPVTPTVVGDPTASNTSPYLFDTNGYYGVNTGTSNTTKITIPHWAADTLYYYCNAHSGMGSSINVTTDIRKADPYAWKCVLAQPLISTQSDVSDQINCNSIEKAITASGATASIVSRNFYGGSTYFDGNDSITTPDNNDYDFGTGEFTVEIWVRPNSISGDQYIVSWEGGNANAAHNGINIYNGNWRIGGFNNALIGGNDGLVANKWTHIAMSRDSNKLRVFVNGVRIGTSSTGAGLNFNCSSNFTLGKYAGNANLNFTGYMSDLRVYKGVSKYTENFVVGSTAPDVLPDTPSGITGKTNLTKITDGAVYLSGSPDELTLADSDDFNFGSGEFTVEAFVEGNFGGGRTGSVILNQSTGGASSDSAFYFGCGYDGVSLYLSTSGNSWTNYIEVANSRITRSGWHHIVWQRRGDLLEIYIDGIKQAVTSGSNSGDAAITGSVYNSSRPIEIGPQNNSGYYAGHISNLRVIKGTALYTSNFTPPTEPLTAVTNTKLLCCQSTTSATAAAVFPTSSGTGYTGNTSAITVTSASLNAGSDTNTVDGNTSTSADIRGAGSFVQLVFPQQQNGTLQVNVANGNDVGDDNIRVFIDGVEGTSFDVSSQQWYTIHTGNFTTVKLEHQGSTTGSIYGFRIGTSGDTITNAGGGITANGDAAATNFNPFTDDINTIRGQESGYATWNPLLKGANTTLSNGNLTVSSSGTTFDGFATGTILIPKTGKWFVEFIAGSLPSSTYYGMYNTRTWNPNGFSGTGFFGLQADSGNKLKSAGASAYMSAVSVGDVVGVMYDADNNTLGFMRNGINYGVAFDNSDSIDYTDDHRVWWNTNGATSIAHTVNFGQKPFKFPPPDGFQPLNLSTVQPEKVIARPDQYVSATLFTGTGDAVSSRTVELPHAADLVWAKSRDRASSHQIADTVRGNNSVLQSNANMTARNPTTQYSGGGVSTIDGKTITIASGTSNNANLNTDNNKGVIWSWKAGGSSNTFNIDDVGYANASDVNMNVGVFNSSTFLKGQVWSGLMSPASGSFDQAASRAFDGFLRTDPNRLRTSGNQVTVTMNLSSSPVTVSSQIKVHAEPGYNSSCTVTVGGVTYTSSTGSLHTFNVSGSLTQMTLQSTQSGGRTYMEGMEIDGKLLVDDNVTINAPSIAPTGCSVGTKQGFSIVAYNATGSNLRVSHGLSERPGLIILKTVHSTTGDWLVWHQSLAGVDRFLKLNDTITQAQADNVFLSIDENTFGTGDDSGINSNGQEKIAYLWHDVPGLQKFGKWTNNNSNDGAFIELGFRPALILLKNTDNVEKWYWIDSSRHTYNEVAPSNNAAGAVNTLQPNTSNTEATSRGSHTNTTVDILSNGFKIRTTNPASGEISFGTRNYIYAAWAEAPSINLYGAQANAR